MAIKKFAALFIVAFLLNLLWEEAHSVLYISYQGREITYLLLIRAALFDALVIAVFASLLRKICESQTLTKFAEAAFVLTLLLSAIALEQWALATGRWVYADAMPIIPLLEVGFTPVIQLGVLGYIALKISNFLWQKRGLTF